MSIDYQDLDKPVHVPLGKDTVHQFAGMQFGHVSPLIANVPLSAVCGKAWLVHASHPLCADPAACDDARARQERSMAESFFATLKTKFYYRRVWATKARAGAHQAVGAWIEDRYNRRRRHSSIGQISPATGRSLRDATLPPDRGRGSSRITPCPRSGVRGQGQSRVVGFHVSSRCASQVTISIGAMSVVMAVCSHRGKAGVVA